MNKESKIKLALWILLIGIFLIFIIFIEAGFFSTTGGLINIELTGTDSGNWIGTSSFNDISFDNTSQRLYIGINQVGGSFGWFDYLLNATINKTFSWTNTEVPNYVQYSYSLNRTFMGTTTDGAGNPHFGWFDPVINQTIEASLSPCFFNNAPISDGDISVNRTTRPQRIYLAQSTSATQRGLFYFETQLNKTVCMTNINDPLNLTEQITELTYDYVRNRTWFALRNVFGYFDEDKNITYNFSNKIPSTLLNTIVDELTYDPHSDVIWMGTRNNRIGYFNITSNLSFVDVTINDISQLLNTSGLDGIKKLSINHRDKTLLISSGGGGFGYYDLSINRTVNLSNLDSGNWIGGTNIVGLSYDVVRKNTFIGAGAGIYGFFGTDVGSNRSNTIPYFTQSPIINMTNGLNSTYLDLNVFFTPRDNETIPLGYNITIFRNNINFSM
ncbi:MAG: hypothetical protein AABY22_04765 [Nanoarchaeota archaeon]